jgi:hypothetical protein
MKMIKFSLIFFSFLQIIRAQTIVIDSNSSIYVESSADVCAGGVGNITSNFYGGGTECGQSIAATFQLAVGVYDGWNIVSVPGLHPVNQNINTWWSGKDPASGVFQFTSGYVSVTEVTPGIGYWMNHIGSNTYNTGDEWPASGMQKVLNVSLTGITGWNLIGGYHLTVATSSITTTPAGLQTGSVFGYSPGSGYSPAANLVPGYGYWIKLTAVGDINIPTSLAKGTAITDYIMSDWSRIILTDAAGKSYTLYSVNGDSPNGTASVNLNQYELPPLPPAGMFDVRYGSQRLAEVIGNEMKTIEMQGADYPVTIRVEGMTIRVQDETGKIVNQVIKSGEEAVISNLIIEKLRVSSNVIPEAYSLDQNFPNPFNPSTRISWQSPVDGHQSLRVYDVLGNEVAVLVDEFRTAGRYDATFDASNLASGIYFYRIQAGSFVQTRKMILLK